MPTRTELDNVLGDPVQQLRALALDPATDFGVRLRAIRSLPLYCQAPCTTDAPHLAILDVLAAIPSGRTGTTILLTRATLEALGETRSGDDADVDLVIPFLGDLSRDLRATSARTLGRLCNQRAIDPLRGRFNVETIPQVQHAITDALRELDEC